MRLVLQLWPNGSRTLLTAGAWVGKSGFSYEQARNNTGRVAQEPSSLAVGVIYQRGVWANSDLWQRDGREATHLRGLHYSAPRDWDLGGAGRGSALPCVRAKQRVE